MDETNPLEAAKSLQVPPDMNNPLEAAKRPLDVLVPETIDRSFANRRTWSEVEPILRDMGADPEKYRQNYQLQEARKVQAGEGIGMAEAFTRSSIPIGSALYNAREASKYGEALKRFNEGKASGEDIGRIARFERLEEIDAERNKSMGGQLVTMLGKAPAIVGEALGAGKVVGALGKAAGIGQAATGVGRLGQFAGGQAVATPLMPSLYLEQATKRNLAEGRDAMDVRGFPTALGMAYAQNLVLGSLTKAGPLKSATDAAPTMLGRSLAKGAVGTAEMAGVDVAGGIADQFLSKQYQTGTKFGVIGKLVQGEAGEALKEATVSTLGFALFAALHDQGAPRKPYAEQPQTPGLIFDPFSRPQDPALPPGPSPRGFTHENPVVEKFVDALAYMKRQGWTAEKAAAEVNNIRDRFKTLIEENPNATPADARKLFERDAPGKLRDFAHAMADTLPEKPITTTGKEVPFPELAGGAPIDPKSPMGKARAAHAAAEVRMKAAEEALQNVKPVNQASGHADRAARLREMDRVSKEYDAAQAELRKARERMQSLEPKPASSSRDGTVPNSAGKVDTVSSLHNPVQGEGLASEKPVSDSPPSPDGNPVKMSGSPENAPESPQSGPAAEPSEPQPGPGSAVGGFTRTLIDRFKAKGKMPERAPEPPPMNRGTGVPVRQSEMDPDRARRAMQRLATQALIRRSQNPASNPASAANPRQKLRADIGEGNFPARVWEARLPGIRTAVGEAVADPSPANMERARAQVESFKRIAAANGYEPQAAIDEQLPKWAAFEAEQALKASLQNPQPVAPAEVAAAEQDVNREISRQLSEGRRKGRSAEATRREIESVVREANEAADAAGAPREAEAGGQPAGAIGHQTGISVPDGPDFPARYELRELGSVIASSKADPPNNLIDRVKSGEYPAGVQPRDYTDAAEVNKVWDNARKMVTGYFISNHPSATNGPPVIDHPGRVINGNSRQMSIEASTHIGTYEKYRADLEKNAAVYGIDPAAVKAMKQPALYRVVDVPIGSKQAHAFARIGNVGETMGQSPERTAASLSNYITPELVASLNLTGEETFSQAVSGVKGRKFREKLANTMPNTMRKTYFEGQLHDLTPAGVALVQNMMLTKLFPVELVEKMGVDRKQVLNTIEAALPSLLKAASDPQFDHINLVPQLTEAMEYLANNPKVKLNDLDANRLDQVDMFSNPLSAGGRMMLDLLLDVGDSKVQFRQKVAKVIAGERASNSLFDDPKMPVDAVENAAKLLDVKYRPGARFGGPRGRSGKITLPSLDDLKNSNVAAGIRTAVDEWSKLRGSMFPATARLSEPVADKMATNVAAGAFGEAATKYIMKAVFSDLKPEAQKKFYAAHVESRLRYMLSRGYTNATTIVGPDSPIKTNAEYLHILQSPAFNRYLKRWQKVVVPIMSKNFRDSQGMGPNDPIISNSQIPGYPINLIRAPEDGVTRTTIGSGGTRVHPERVTQRRNQFAKSASGEAEFGYELDPEKAITKAMSDSMAAAARANLDRTIVELGLGKWAGPGDPVPLTKQGPAMKPVRHVDPKPGTQVANRRQDTLFVDPKILDEYHNAIGLGGSFRVPVLTPTLAAATRVALVSTVEVAYHSANLAMQAAKPYVLRNMLRETLKYAAPLLKGRLPELSEAQLERLMKLSELGATKAAGFQSGFLIPDSVAEKYPAAKYLDPTRWGSHILDSVDALMRLASDGAFEQAARNGLAHNTPKNKRDFLNALGNYLNDSQQIFVRMLRGTGIGPFATAGVNTPVQSIRSLWFTAGMQGKTLAAQVRLRAHVLAKLAAVIGAGLMLNWINWGRIDGDDSVPWGAVKVGEDNGRTYYVDPIRFMGPRRGLNVTGGSAVIEGQRTGASTESVMHKAAEDVKHALIHPAAGPGVQVAKILGTGSNMLGTNVAGFPDERAGTAFQRTQLWENMKAAMKNANPSLAALIGADRVKPGEAMPLFPLTGKGEGFIGDFSRDEPAGQNALKLLAPYLMSRKKMPEATLRQFMEKEAMPKREIPVKRRR